MARISAWFGGLSTGVKGLVVAAALVLFVVLSPFVAIVAVLFLIVAVPVVAYRALMRRPLRRPGLILIGSLVALIAASGASAALYGTSADQTSSLSEPTAEPEKEEPRKEPAREEAAVANEGDPNASEPQEEQKTTEPDPKPEPKPEPRAKPEPEPEPKPRPDRNRSPYDATVTVSRVVDGDTVEISPAIDGITDVRLIGIDTPETVDPGEEVEPYGREASTFATGELTGRKVGLEFDAERIDQYDRLLAYVYTGDRMFNEDLVAKGYAQAYPYPPNTTHELRFEQAQREAKAGDVGIWGLPLNQQCLLADRGNGIGEGSIECDLLAEESASPSASASADSSATAEASGAAPWHPSPRTTARRTRPSRATNRASTTCRKGRTTT